MNEIIRLINKSGSMTVVELAKKVKLPRDQTSEIVIYLATNGVLAEARRRNAWCIKNT